MADDIFARLKSALADRYRLERLVGQGGMATVYLAEDLKHHRQVAIKVLRSDLAASLGAERFLREIELAAKLQHPHIVPVYDSGSADSILYYVMPFVEGESLRDLLKREKRLPLHRAADIVRAAASGLSYAHGQGIVHRDVKPENIMLSDGHAVVTDFGIARAITESRNADANLTGAGMAMGTPAYMSPEQATADRIDARTDQYALACVFYEMVSGQQAFSGPTMQAMLTSILTGARPRLSLTVQDIPPAVDSATQRALASDPEKRFDSITQFADAVGQESSGAAAATRESRRWKKLAIVLPAMAAVIAAVAVTMFARPRSSVVSGAETIAIVPFTTSGAGLEGLSEGMIDLLSPNLDGVGDIVTVKPRTVLNEWHKRVKEEGSSLEDALAVARATHAASVLTGSIVSTGGTARLTAELFDLDGKSLATTSVSGGTDSVLILADNLALSLLKAIWRSRDPLPSANVSLINSTSMPAIRAYLRGESFHRRGNWDSAQVAFEEAVKTDSTFALAWYRLATTLGWAGGYGGPAFKAAAVNAEKYSTGLSPRLRLLMVGYHLFADQSVVATDSAVSYTRQFPRDADGWFLLGESQYHTAGYSPRPPPDLLAPFDKVLALDSTLSPAAIHPMEIAVALRDTALLKHYEQIFRSSGAVSQAENFAMAQRVLLGDDSLFAAVVHKAVGNLLPMSLLAGRFAGTNFSGDSVAAFVTAMISGTPDPMGKQQLRLVGGHLLASVGRVAKARELVAGLQENGTGADSMVAADPVWAGIADSSSYARMDAKLAQHPDDPFGNMVRAVIALNTGNPVKAQAFARASVTGPAASRLPPWFAGAATAIDGLALVAQGDTLHGMSRADSGLRLIAGKSGNFVDAIHSRYAEVEVARVATRAQGIWRLRYGFPTSPGMFAVNTYRLGRAYESAGFADSAAVQYRRFIALWAGADSVYDGLMSEAKAGLARVSADKPANSPVGKKS